MCLITIEPKGQLVPTVQALRVLFDTSSYCVLDGVHMGPKAVQKKDTVAPIPAVSLYKHIIQWHVPIVDLPADLTIPHF
jgi:hypothetical protein